MSAQLKTLMIAVIKSIDFSVIRFRVVSEFKSICGFRATLAAWYPILFSWERKSSVWPDPSFRLYLSTHIKDYSLARLHPNHLQPILTGRHLQPGIRTSLWRRTSAAELVIWREIRATGYIFLRKPPTFPVHFALEACCLLSASFNIASICSSEIWAECLISFSKPACRIASSTPSLILKYWFFIAKVW